ncbi:glycine zipper domain-containing protein [Hyphomonas sp.]|uniref:glycine zipper domain-containing protein n=1 Tax=Hyphomonas sp. TaxID=87 RepID=UPI00391A24F2
MVATQTTSRKSGRGNGHDKKAVAARAAKDELQTAQDAATTFVSALKSSAGHFGDHLTRAAEEKANKAQEAAKAAADVAVERAQSVRTRIEDKVREKPLTAIGVAAGAGVLLALITRR